ncbi:MAG TPA: DUF4173 domain-containing protein [Pyrinomonadaceae bacterium]|nr:DUF4173 domain-containing protein [Pyrinomonadaceae bacterium]
MTERTKLGLCVLGAGLMLGLLGDALLRAEPWGLNVPLWVGALAAAAATLHRRGGFAAARDGRWLMPCALAFAAAFAWRDSVTLRLLDAFAILALLALALLRARGGLVRRGGVTDYLLASLASGAHAAFGSLLLLFEDIKWGEIPREGWSRHVAPALRGLVIAVPLVLVFGALFVAADAVYEGLVNHTFDFEAESVASHVLLFAVFAWLSAGFLRGMFLGRGPRDARAPAYVLLGFSVNGRDAAALTGAPAQAAAARAAEPKNVSAVEAYAAAEADCGVESGAGAAEEAGEVKATGERPPADAPRAGSDAAAAFFAEASAEQRRAAVAAQAAGARKAATHPARAGLSLGIVEVGVALGLLNALFLSFVAVQLRYFFGGARVVLESAGLTYAEYARRGFFELVWVAALVLPLLLAAHWLLRKENPAHERVFRALAGGLLVMLFVIMASALGRMRLYQSEYGQTELRFYTTAFMGWLAAVFVWFALTALRGARERFACGALVAALAVLAALHVVNPDEHIVRTNAALAGPGRGFDAPYAVSLGADAVPALVETLPELTPHDRARVSLRLLEWGGRQGGDWRSWNWSRAAARRGVRDNEAMLREWARQGSSPGVAAERAAYVAP